MKPVYRRLGREIWRRRRRSEVETSQTEAAMALDNQSQFTSSSLSQNRSSFDTVEAPPPENAAAAATDLNCYIPQFGFIIRNRIFVGGIGYVVSERDLQRVFSQFGQVKKVNIVKSHHGIPKGYGFVTFETQEDALKVLDHADGIFLRGRKLNVGQAVFKHRSSGQIQSVHVAGPDPARTPAMSCGTSYLASSTSNPYIYHHGEAYFHHTSVNPPSHHWPCVPNQCQWTIFQSPIPSSPVVYPQSPEYIYQPANGGSVPPPHSTPEFAEPVVYPMRPQIREGLGPSVPQFNAGMSLMWSFM